jgi:predicted phage terminase large subunit-like protein
MIAGSLSSFIAGFQQSWPDRDKRARVISQCDLFEGGSVLFPEKAPWLEDFTNELLAFPGRHDDQVDALVQGLVYRREGFGAVRQGQVIGMF